MLKDNFKCEEERMILGKKKISVVRIDSFEIVKDNYKPKQFKPKDPF